MSRFSVDDCEKLKQLLSNKPFKSSSVSKKKSKNKSNNKFNKSETKSGPKSKSFKKSKLSQLNNNKLKSSINKNKNNPNKGLGKKWIDEKRNKNERKEKNKLKFGSDLKQDSRNKSKLQTFGESHLTRSLQLAEKSRERLSASQFRSINEFLYSHKSSEANSYLTNEMFNSYHSIYEKIVEKWPQKPIDYIINKIKSYITKGSNEIQIADVGCGNLPQIKMAFPNSIVHSFDLVSSHESIITADMTKLPLNNGECDFAVYSLSLMATNLRDCLAEANRILKTDGRLIIVEVLSRFDGNENSFVKTMGQFGFDFINKELLPPNSFFIFFEFNKLKECKKRNSLPDITLKPCVYKPR